MNIFMLFSLVQICILNELYSFTLQVFTISVLPGSIGNSHLNWFLLEWLESGCILISSHRSLSIDKWILFPSLHSCSLGIECDGTSSGS